MTKVREIIEIVEAFAPSRVSADWDNVGLQVGSEDADVERILISLDVTKEVIQEAKSKGANLIVAHHPVTSGKINNITSGSFDGSRLWMAANQEINIFAAHTNLDVCPGGVSDVLAEKLGLEDVEVLHSDEGKEQYKLVCFVPLSHIGEVTEAIAGAGGGLIGDYSHCFFRVSGKGTFKPGKSSEPFLGTAGSINEVDEIRLETVVSADRLQDVLTQMVEAHPYEEVTYDIYNLYDARPSTGWGRIGNLKELLSLGACIEMWQRSLETESIRVSGDLLNKVQRIAVCGGSGGDLIGVAQQRGAEVYVTGDVKYHDAQLADFLGLVIVDAGHYFTERPIVVRLASLIEEKLTDRHATAAVLISEVNTNPWSSGQALGADR